MNPVELLSVCLESPISSWAEGTSQVPSAPWLAYINLTNLCNSKCRVCAHPTAMRPERGLMNEGLFQGVVDQLPAQVKKVYLQKQGEPLLHPGLEAMAAYLRRQRPDIHIAFHTNGIIANPRRMEVILPLVDSLGVSVSATSGPVYRIVHGTGAFDAVMRNLGGINNILTGLSPEQRPHVFIDYVRQQANAHEPEEMVVDFFKKQFPHLSSVDIHWAYNFQGEIKEGNLDIYRQLSHDHFPTCVFPWSSIAICHDGQVSYCFVEPRENRFLGDFKENSFAEIWNSKPYQDFRELMAGKRFQELAAQGYYCHQCSWLWSMRSQSPRNLAGGYALQPGKRGPDLQMGELLDWPQEKVLEAAASAYLGGETLQALSYCQLLSQCEVRRETAWASHRLLKLCRKVLARYELAYTWRDLMDQQGLSHDQRECRYYGQGEQDVQQCSATP